MTPLEGIINAAEAVWEWISNVASWAVELWTQAVDAVADTASSVINWGKDAIEWVENKIEQKWIAWLWDWIVNPIEYYDLQDKYWEKPKISDEDRSLSNRFKNLWWLWMAWDLVKGLTWMWISKWSDVLNWTWLKNSLNEWIVQKDFEAKVKEYESLLRDRQKKIHDISSVDPRFTEYRDFSKQVEKQYLSEKWITTITDQEDFSNFQKMQLDLLDPFAQSNILSQAATLQESIWWYQTEYTEKQNELKNYLNNSIKANWEKTWEEVYNEIQIKQDALVKWNDTFTLIWELNNKMSEKFDEDFAKDAKNIVWIWWTTFMNLKDQIVEKATTDKQYYLELLWMEDLPDNEKIAAKFKEISDVWYNMDLEMVRRYAILKNDPSYNKENDEEVRQKAIKQAYQSLSEEDKDKLRSKESLITSISQATNLKQMKDRFLSWPIDTFKSLMDAYSYSAATVERIFDKVYDNDKDEVPHYIRQEYRSLITADKWNLDKFLSVIAYNPDALLSLATATAWTWLVTKWITKWAALVADKWIWLLIKTNIWFWESILKVFPKVMDSKITKWMKWATNSLLQWAPWDAIIDNTMMQAPSDVSENFNMITWLVFDTAIYWAGKWIIQVWSLGYETAQKAKNSIMYNYIYKEDWAAVDDFVKALDTQNNIKLDRNSAIKLMEKWKEIAYTVFSPAKVKEIFDKPAELFNFMSKNILWMEEWRLKEIVTAEWIWLHLEDVTWITWRQFDAMDDAVLKWYDLKSWSKEYEVNKLLQDKYLNDALNVATWKWTYDRKVTPPKNDSYYETKVIEIKQAIQQIKLAPSKDEATEYLDIIRENTLAIQDAYSNVEYVRSIQVSFPWDTWRVINIKFNDIEDFKKNYVDLIKNWQVKIKDDMIIEWHKFKKWTAFDIYKWTDLFVEKIKNVMISRKQTITKLWEAYWVPENNIQQTIRTIVWKNWTLDKKSWSQVMWFVSKVPIDKQIWLMNEIWKLIKWVVDEIYWENNFWKVNFINEMKEFQAAKDNNFVVPWEDLINYFSREEWLLNLTYWYIEDKKWWRNFIMYLTAGKELSEQSEFEDMLSWKIVQEWKMIYKVSNYAKSVWALMRSIYEYWEKDWVFDLETWIKNSRIIHASSKVTWMFTDWVLDKDYITATLRHILDIKPDTKEFEVLNNFIYNIFVNANENIWILVKPMIYNIAYKYAEHKPLIDAIIKKIWVDPKMDDQYIKAFSDLLLSPKLIEPLSKTLLWDKVFKSSLAKTLEPQVEKEWKRYVININNLIKKNQNWINTLKEQKKAIPDKIIKENLQKKIEELILIEKWLKKELLWNLKKYKFKTNYTDSIINNFTVDYIKNTSDNFATFSQLKPKLKDSIDLKVEDLTKSIEKDIEMKWKFWQLTTEDLKWITRLISDLRNSKWLLEKIDIFNKAIALWWSKVYKEVLEYIFQKFNSKCQSLNVVDENFILKEMEDIINDTMTAEFAKKNNPIIKKLVAFFNNTKTWQEPKINKAIIDWAYSWKDNESLITIGKEYSYNNLPCSYTSKFNINKLLIEWMDVYPIDVWIKWNLFWESIYHKVALLKEDWKIFIYDMPQNEFLEHNWKNVKVIKNYEPRKIEFTIDNLIKEYWLEIKESIDIYNKLINKSNKSFNDILWWPFILKDWLEWKKYLIDPKLIKKDINYDLSASDLFNLWDNKFSDLIKDLNSKEYFKDAKWEYINKRKLDWYKAFIKEILDISWYKVSINDADNIMEVLLKDINNTKRWQGKDLFKKIRALWNKSNDYTNAKWERVKADINVSIEEVDDFTYALKDEVEPDKYTENIIQLQQMVEKWMNVNFLRWIDWWKFWIIKSWKIDKYWSELTLKNIFDNFFKSQYWIIEQNYINYAYVTQWEIYKFITALINNQTNLISVDLISYLNKKKIILKDLRARVIEQLHIRKWDVFAWNFWDKDSVFTLYRSDLSIYDSKIKDIEKSRIELDLFEYEYALKNWYFNHTGLKVKIDWDKFSSEFKNIKYSTYEAFKKDLNIIENKFKESNWIKREWRWIILETNNIRKRESANMSNFSTFDDIKIPLKTLVLAKQFDNSWIKYNDDKTINVDRTIANKDTPEYIRKRLVSITDPDEQVSFLDSAFNKDNQDWTSFISWHMARLRDRIQWWDWEDVFQFKDHFYWDVWDNGRVLWKTLFNSAEIVYEWSKLDNAVVIWKSSLKLEWWYVTFDTPKDIIIDWKLYKVLWEVEWTDTSFFRNASSESTSDDDMTTLSDSIKSRLWYEYSKALTELQLKAIQKSFQNNINSLWDFNINFNNISDIDNIISRVVWLVKRWTLTDSVAWWRLKQFLSEVDEILNKPQDKWTSVFIRESTNKITAEEIIVSKDSQLVKWIIEDKLSKLDTVADKDKIEAIKNFKEPLFTIWYRYPVPSEYNLGMYRIRFSDEVDNNWKKLWQEYENMWWDQVVTNPITTYLKLEWDNDWDHVFFINAESEFWDIVWKSIFWIKLSENRNLIDEFKNWEHLNNYIIADQVDKWLRNEKYKWHWKRSDIENIEDKVFLFWDNTDDRLNTKHVPTSTQAVIRWLPNAIWIDTKKNRWTDASSYFTDADFDIFKKQVDEAIINAKASWKVIVVSEWWIWTDKAMLETKAPKLFNYLKNELDKLFPKEVSLWESRAVALEAKQSVWIVSATLRTISILRQVFDKYESLTWDDKIKFWKRKIRSELNPSNLKNPNLLDTITIEDLYKNIWQKLLTWDLRKYNASAASILQLTLDFGNSGKTEFDKNWFKDLLEYAWIDNNIWIYYHDLISPLAKWYKLIKMDEKKLSQLKRSYIKITKLLEKSPDYKIWKIVTEENWYTHAVFNKDEQNYLLLLWTLWHKWEIIESFFNDKEMFNWKTTIWEYIEAINTSNDIIFLCKNFKDNKSNKLLTDILNDLENVNWYSMWYISKDIWSYNWIYNFSKDELQENILIKLWLLDTATARSSLIDTQKLLNNEKFFLKSNESKLLNYKIKKWNTWTIEMQIENNKTKIAWLVKREDRLNSFIKDNNIFVKDYEDILKQEFTWSMWKFTILDYLKKIKNIYDEKWNKEAQKLIKKDLIEYIKVLPEEYQWIWAAYAITLWENRIFNFINNNLQLKFLWDSDNIKWDRLKNIWLDVNFEEHMWIDKFDNEYFPKLLKEMEADLELLQKSWDTEWAEKVMTSIESTKKTIYEIENNKLLEDPIIDSSIISNKVEIQDIDNYVFPEFSFNTVDRSTQAVNEIMSEFTDAVSLAKDWIKLTKQSLFNKFAPRLLTTFDTIQWLLNRERQTFRTITENWVEKEISLWSKRIISNASDEHVRQFSHNWFNTWDTIYREMKKTWLSAKDISDIEKKFSYYLIESKDWVFSRPNLDIAIDKMKSDKWISSKWSILKLLDDAKFKTILTDYQTNVIDPIIIALNEINSLFKKDVYSIYSKLEAPFTLVTDLLEAHKWDAQFALKLIWIKDEADFHEYLKNNAKNMAYNRNWEMMSYDISDFEIKVMSKAVFKNWLSMLDKVLWFAKWFHYNMTYWTASTFLTQNSIIAWMSQILPNYIELRAYAAKNSDKLDDAYRLIKTQWLMDFEDVLMMSTWFWKNLNQSFLQQAISKFTKELATNAAWKVVWKDSAKRAGEMVDSFINNMLWFNDRPLENLRKITAVLQTMEQFKFKDMKAINLAFENWWQEFKNVFQSAVRRNFANSWWWVVSSSAIASWTIFEDSYLMFDNFVTQFAVKSFSYLMWWSFHKAATLIEKESALLTWMKQLYLWNTAWFIAHFHDWAMYNSMLAKQILYTTWIYLKFQKYEKDNEDRLSIWEFQKIFNNAFVSVRIIYDKQLNAWNTAWEYWTKSDQVAYTTKTLLDRMTRLFKQWAFINTAYDRYVAQSVLWKWDMFEALQYATKQHYTASIRFNWMKESDDYFNSISQDSNLWILWLWWNTYWDEMFKELSEWKNFASYKDKWFIKSVLSGFTSLVKWDNDNIAYSVLTDLSKDIQTRIQKDPNLWKLLKWWQIWFTDKDYNLSSLLWMQWTSMTLDQEANAKDILNQLYYSWYDRLDEKWKRILTDKSGKQFTPEKVMSILEWQINKELEKQTWKTLEQIVSVNWVDKWLLKSLALMDMNTHLKTPLFLYMIINKEKQLKLEEAKKTDWIITGKQYFWKQTLALTSEKENQITRDALLKYQEYLNLDNNSVMNIIEKDVQKNYWDLFTKFEEAENFKYAKNDIMKLVSTEYLVNNVMKNWDTKVATLQSKYALAFKWLKWNETWIEVWLKFLNQIENNPFMEKKSKLANQAAVIMWMSKSQYDLFNDNERFKTLTQDAQKQITNWMFKVSTESMDYDSKSYLNDLNATAWKRTATWDYKSPFKSNAFSWARPNFSKQFDPIRKFIPWKEWNLSRDPQEYLNAKQDFRPQWFWFNPAKFEMNQEYAWIIITNIYQGYQSKWIIPMYVVKKKVDETEKKYINLKAPYKKIRQKFLGTWFEDPVRTSKWLTKWLPFSPE